MIGLILEVLHFLMTTAIFVCGIICFVEGDWKMGVVFLVLCSLLEDK